MAHLVRICGVTKGKGWYLPEWQNFLEHIKTFNAAKVNTALGEYNGRLY